MANCIVIHPDCRDCLVRHMAERKLVFDVRTSERVARGELVIASPDAGAQNFGCVLCGGGICPLGVDQYAKLLERIRTGDLPAYGKLSWDGRRRQVEITAQFDEGDGASDEVVRRRALRYLESLTPEERAVVDMEIEVRDGRPVRARLKAKTGAFSAQRLRELAGRV